MKHDFLQQIDRIRELPALPAVVIKVNQMLQDMETTSDQLSHQKEIATARQFFLEPQG